MKQIKFARKKRQLKYYSIKLQRLIDCQKDTLNVEIKKLIIKIKKLTYELLQVFSAVVLKRIMGPAVGLLILSSFNQVNGQIFDSPKPNSFGLDSLNLIAFPAFADLDNDGDLDLLVGEYLGNMQYFENTGTSSAPAFAAPLQNPFGLSPTYLFATPAFADLDADGDMDMISGEYYGNMIYYENIGSASNPQFAPPQINPFGLDSTNMDSFPAFADLDGDGDFDLLVGEYYGSMQYFENIGTPENPQFSASQENPFGLSSAYVISVPAFTDIDLDGDLDLVVGEYYGNFQYFENTGNANNPQFAPPVQNPFGLVPTYYFSFPSFADIYNDGDFDLFAGEYYGAIQFFRNNDITGIPNLTNNIDVNIFPNPVSDRFSVRTSKEVKRVEIYSLFGVMVQELDNPTGSIPVSELKNEMYIVKIIFRDGTSAIKKMNKI